MRYEPSRKRSSVLCRSFVGVWWVMLGIRNSRLMRYTVALSSVKISVRSFGWLTRISSRTRSLPSVPYARDRASRWASMAARPWGEPLAMMNCFQPSREPELDAVQAQEVVALPDQGVVAVLLGVAEPDLDHDFLVVGQRGSGQVFGTAGIHHRAEQGLQVTFPPVAALQGGRQPQAVRGQAHLRDHPREVAGQVVALVADQQRILPRQVFSVNGGGIVGAHQDRRVVVTAAAQQADVGIWEGRQQARVPLL